MSYKSYSNYLGVQRCCNTSTTIKGAQGAQGAGGPIGPQGAQGAPGAGASGSSGINSVYLALTPQSPGYTLPTGLDGIWLENSGSLRIKKMYLDNPDIGVASINFDPTNTTQIKLDDGINKTTEISGADGILISDTIHSFSASSTNIILPSLVNLPTGSPGMIIFQGDHFWGFNGSTWKQLDNI